MKSSISFSKKTLFSQRVSSASMRRVFRRIGISLAAVQAMKKRHQHAANLSRRFTGAGGEFFEHGARDLLDFAEAGEVVLKFLIHHLRFVGCELDAHNHVAEL